MTAADSGRDLQVLMTGAEWFGVRAGGLNRYFESLHEALDRQPGVSVSAVAFGEPRPPGDSWGDLDRDLVRRTLASRRTAVAGVDVLDRHFAPYGPSRRSLDAATRVVIHFQGPWFAESLAQGQGRARARVKQWWESRRYSDADRAVVLCEEFGSILQREFGVPGDRILVIPPGVDLERFAAAPSPDGERPLVLCVRRLERRMGIDILLSAWPVVLDAVPEARLGIVGTGTHAKVLRDQADALGLADSVELHGSVSDEALPELYAAASLTVVPTRELEGFGLIALESLAMGRPVIVTRVGGLPDAVEGLDPSLVVPPEDPRALAGRIVEALSGVAPSAARCRTHAETFGWDRVAERHAEVYRELSA